MRCRCPCRFQYPTTGRWVCDIANCTRGAVLDPFAGSGTTLVACTQLGRTCYAIERDPGSVAVILQRMADLGITPTLLARANGIE